ncbi:MAG: hypothetical protein MI753_06290, partial [Hyphomicrobiales bacterium]|nr:hypothetical protein [Hyphomicrobiales bacterium]
LNSSRIWNDGPQRFSYTEIAAWLACTGTQITIGEMAILRQVDQAFCTAINQERADIQARERERG